MFDACSDKLPLPLLLGVRFGFSPIGFFFVRSPRLIPRL
jgi:hypothetical protein